MERSDLDAEMAAADQELSALLEKHINVPVRRSIEEVNGGLSLTLKGDFEASVLSLRSELKKLNSAFEELGDDLGSVHKVSKRVETMVQKAEGAQESRFERAGAQVAESARQVTEGIVSVEERLSKLGAAQLHHLNTALRTLATDIQFNNAESLDGQKKILETLEGILSSITAQDEQALEMKLLSKRWRIWMCVAFSVNLGILIVLLIKAFL
ncbi:hypothetical protein N7366_10530 [Aeromonas caviae]|uniref:hypothetical protein n=1 Tax=Aeromonas caviae TaxID=648 RepID=UPI000FEC1797|nr:hypothetical protein [Aeromonas caviae]MBL0439688.1 hypothetical protein [Aeromonas caviae]MDH0433689.1 hypothetical protein [Aeromonas caviae]MDH0936537.1 hypothetical protein [Aeromonas caviae]MDH1397347.1 hypothetical protein [Aeromonas caviae]MDH1850286.1 hypothetical protein [Aeromonas caviae]